MTKPAHTLIFASGLKGKQVRADGEGASLPRGWYFHSANGLQGPFGGKRLARAALAKATGGEQ